ncbi:MAG: hypothetical protein C0404_05500 [Verrucomicrobia bacterium]|nr:hypothetical protein [Verrucomicrobiota bacterium]
MTQKRAPQPLEKRMREIQEELSLVNGDIRTLKKAIAKPDKPLDVSKLRTVRLPDPSAPQERELPGMAEPRAVSQPRPVAPAHQPEPEARPAAQQPSQRQPPNKSVYNERFGDYLASSFEARTARPLRHEREVQKRNAIIMVVIIVIMIVWTAYKLLM